MMLCHTQVLWVIDPVPNLEGMNQFEIFEQLFRNWYLMIRWFMPRFLDWKEVMRLTSVEKWVHDIVFSQGAYKKMDFAHIIQQHFKAQQISDAIVKPQLTLGPRILDRAIFACTMLTSTDSKKPSN